MPRARRNDYVGAVFHVTNRAVGRRLLFETKADGRRFLALLARTVHGGLLNVYAYALLPTRFHLLVRSRSGRLSEAMRWIQDLYARRLNRRRERAGPVFRGRFRTKLLLTTLHRVAVLHYVHGSPVCAGLVERAADHRLSSAAALAADRPPPWLEGLPALRGGVDDAGATVSWDLVDRWLAHPDPGPVELDDLVGAPSSVLAAWLVRGSRDIARTLPAFVIVRGDPIQRLVAVAREAPLGREIRPRRGGPSSWDLLEAGLLRTVCGLTLVEIAERLGISTVTAHGRVRAHLAALASGPVHAERAARVLRQALWAEYGGLCRTSRPLHGGRTGTR